MNSIKSNSVRLKYQRFTLYTNKLRRYKVLLINLTYFTSNICLNVFNFFSDPNNQPSAVSIASSLYSSEIIKKIKIMKKIKTIIVKQEQIRAALLLLKKLLISIED